MLFKSEKFLNYHHLLKQGIKEHKIKTPTLIVSGIKKWTENKVETSEENIKTDCSMKKQKNMECEKTKFSKATQKCLDPAIAKTGQGYVCNHK